jgi:hypothetical protein
MAWSSAEGLNQGSVIIILFAAVRLSPTPPSLMEQTSTLQSSSFWNFSRMAYLYSRDIFDLIMSAVELGVILVFL